MAKTKCFSVRLSELRSISEKAYVAKDFNGNECIIPKSQVFGYDHDVQNSEAFWISAWILEQKHITYSTKKWSFFERAAYMDSGVEIERHVPDVQEPVQIDADPELLK